MSPIRVFLSLVGVLSLHTYQFDIKTGFLNETLEEVIYVKPVYDHVNILDKLLQTRRSLSPQVMNHLILEKRILTQQNGVRRLRKALLNLKQAPRAPGGKIVINRSGYFKLNSVAVLCCCRPQIVM